MFSSAYASSSSSAAAAACRRRCADQVRRQPHRQLAADDAEEHGRGRAARNAGRPAAGQAAGAAGSARRRRRSGTRGSRRPAARLPAGGAGHHPAAGGHRLPARLQHLELVPLRQPVVGTCRATSSAGQLHQDVQLAAWHGGARADPGLHRRVDRLRRRGGARPGADDAPQVPRPRLPARLGPGAVGDAHGGFGDAVEDDVRPARGLRRLLPRHLPPGLVQPGLARASIWRSWAAIFIADSWKNIPFVAIILLAGLQVIPNEVYEAARWTAPPGGSRSAG